MLKRRKERPASRTCIYKPPTHHPVIRDNCQPIREKRIANVREHGVIDEEIRGTFSVSNDRLVYCRDGIAKTFGGI